MAGVVAMASVIEDFDSQPCKKSRKDGGSPVVKTITNYFSPLSKSVEKPFSPPRSNNIMDYFIRKAPCSKEIASSPEQLKENCQTSQLDEKQPSPGEGVKQTSRKRSRKTTKAARKLVEAETIVLTDEESCLIVKEPCDNRNVRAEPDVDCSVFCSDTTALLLHLNSEACVTAGKLAGNVVKTVSEKDDHHLDGSKCGTDVKLKPELDGIELSPVVASKPKTKQVKTVVQNSLKKQQQKAKPSDTEEKDDVISLCDDGMEASVDEASLLNRCTVTISFEEFVRSQSQDRAEENVEDESELASETKENDTDQLRFTKAEENVGSMEPPLRVSPRTVTIQAEVHSHAVLPKLETKAKVASIFNNRKATTGPAEVELSPHMASRQQLTSTSLCNKRKSNVILDEEDLELAVIESESTPKSSVAERKQFMAAFKQVGLHGSKVKTAKNQGNQKQPGELLHDAEKVPEEDDIIPASIEQVPPAFQDIQIPKSKHTTKGKKKVLEIKEAAPAPPAAAPEEEAVTTTVENDDDDEREKNPITSVSSTPGLRRSSRGASVRQPSETVTAGPTTKTMRGSESKDAAVTLPKDSPAGKSTPKTRRSKHGVFVAKMVGPPDTKQSPIRIKFTRVHKNVPMGRAESGLNTSLANKTINESENRRQAKKLVEKAKMIQQSKTAVEERGALRRSARAEANVKKSYCEDENSVICLEGDKTTTLHAASEKSKTQKSLRNLNDVLGKATPAGSKVALLGQEKSARRVSEVISIFDESSREGSENSQDDEQFKARREFLKSGLPECFRKQIAKTVASKEAYSLSCSSFQPVVHVKQPAKDCPLWSLVWPESLLLSHLKEFWYQTNPHRSVSGSFSVKTEPTRRTFYELGSGWRPEISDRVRQVLTEEVGMSNPLFPVQMFVNHFLKRCRDHQQQSSATEPANKATVTSASVRGKRKRMDDEREMTVKVAKKHRVSSSEENISSSEPAKRGGRVRRSQRSMPDEEPSVKAATIPTENDSEVVLLGEDNEKKDFGKEDVLWTDKHQPQDSSHIIGNTASVRRLHSWLKEWKLRADREERKKQKDKKQEEESNDSEWDCGEEDFQDGEDSLCNTILITGPTGVGKTAAVYACAQELGFKVFEVNASSQRSGRLILSQLKEATQSHQVDSQGVNALKPTYFNSYGTSSSGTLRPGSSPRKVNSPRRVVSSPRKHPQSPRGTKRGGLAPTSLAKFFKMGRPTNKETSNSEKKEQTATSKNGTKARECGGMQKDLALKSQTAKTPKEKNNEHSKKTATSLILFEEVDIIFDEDSGFLAAIKTFMTTTKRPVILTTSDPAFSTMFDGNFEEIHFKAPSVSDASCFLRLLCLAEDVKTDQRDISSLLRFNSCDMRRSLLQLQFWARSGGSRYTTKPMPRIGKKETDEASSVSVCDASVPMALPHSEPRCTESMLGLLNIEPERDIWELLKSHSLTEERLCRELLTNSRQLGMDVLYSNLETLLPLPLSQLTASTNKTEQCVSLSQDQLSANSVELPSTCSQLDKLPSQDGLNTQMEGSAECLDDGSPVKISSRMRKNKRRNRLPDQDGLDSDSDSEDSFLSLSKQQGAGQKKEEVKESLLSQTVKRKPLSPEEQLKSLPVSKCLQSIAEFLDNMSYMDSSFPSHPEEGDGHCGMLSLVKDGMTDEMRVEIDRRRWVRGGHTLEIQAAVEAMSFQKCRGLVAEAWDETQQLEGELRKEAVAEVTLPVAAHCGGYSFNQDGPIPPQLVEQRREVMESLMFRGVCGTLGNRSAAALDYLPALRTICRSEQLKEQGKVKRRFLHYLDAVHLGLDKSTLQHLAEDFP